MKRSFRLLVMLGLLAFLTLNGCSNNSSALNVKDNHFYRFKGELLSVVDQRKNTESQTFGGDYTVTVTEASPEIKRFKEYNQSNGTPDDYFYITELAHIYRVNQDDSKRLISQAELEAYRGNKIEFWVSPIKNRQWDLTAIEITVLE